jgi:hypothetical protein
MSPVRICAGVIRIRYHSSGLGTAYLDHELDLTYRDAGDLGDLDGLETTLSLPLPVGKLPVTPTEVKYLRVDPMKSGETKTLDIHWELPADTGNLVQGNTLSFTLNYMLRGAKTIDVSDNATEGEVLEDIIIYSQNEHGNIKITANVTAKTADNQTPIDIWLVEVDNATPPDPPGNKAFAGLYYDGGPDGLVFSSPITITLAYDPANIAAGVSELDVYIALWDTTLLQWVPLPNCVVDTVAKTVSAQISHFSHYTVLTPTLPASPPPTVPPIVPPVTPPVTPEEPPEPEKEPATLEVTVFEEESFVYVDDDGTLEKTLYLQDEDGTIVIEVQAGTKVTDSEGDPLSRIELTLVEVEVELPDGTVVLTPGYKLTGYDQDRVETDIVFSPGAAISIRYNPNDLPDNSFLPFVAFYSPETGLIQLPLPDGFLVGVGWAQGLITSGGIFLAAVEEAPAPPPLPANFTATNLVIDPGEIFEGDPVRISVTITNEGELPGTAELYLLINGIVRAIQEITLDGRTSEILTFEIANLAAGLHHIEIAKLQGTSG